jgi:CheY-like chemotaxis protein
MTRSTRNGRAEGAEDDRMQYSQGEPTGEPLRLLIVDDSQADAELAIHALRKGGYAPVARVVDTEAAFVAALDEKPALILCDHKMPRFESARALELLAEMQLDIPLILLSGTMNREIGVAAVLRGAADYVFKDQIESLIPVVRRLLDARRGPATPH